jgi:sugar lactone lactonase YvrE
MKIVLLLLLVLPFGGWGQTITTVAGTGVAGFSGDGGAATAATLHSPGDVAVDNLGNVFSVDFDNHRIRKISTAGIISTIAGTGMAGYNGDGIAATLAQISYPTGVAVDETGNIFIAERGGNRIRKVNTSGSISTVAGNGVGGFSGDGLAATVAEINFPYAVAVDSHGDIYIADGYNYRVRKINSSGIITTIAGNGISGYSGDGGPATLAQFSNLGYVTVSRSGEIYFGDHSNNRIRKVNTAGIISTFAGNGVNGNSGDGGPATAAQLNAPNGVAIDNFGNTYIVDDYAHVVRKVNVTGIISTVVGTGTAGFSGDGSTATSAKLNNPNAICVNNAGNLFIADANNQRIRKVTYHPDEVDIVRATQMSIAIFPNPAPNKLSLSSATDIETAMVVNMLGEVIMAAYPLAAKEVTLNVGSLPAGVYCVMVNGVYGGRFVKE